MRAIGAEKGEPGTKFATPVFDGALEDEISGLLSATLSPTRPAPKMIMFMGPDDT